MDNDAFRKIMATPRPHDSKPQEKFDKKSIRKRGWSEGEVKWRAWLATQPPAPTAAPTAALFWCAQRRQRPMDKSPVYCESYKCHPQC